MKERKISVQRFGWAKHPCWDVPRIFGNNDGAKILPGNQTTYKPLSLSSSDIKKHLESKQPPYNQYNQGSVFMTLSVLYVSDVDHRQSVRKINLNLSLVTHSLVHFTINCKGLQYGSCPPLGLITTIWLSNHHLMISASLDQQEEMVHCQVKSIGHTPGFVAKTLTWGGHVTQIKIDLPKSQKKCLFC